MMPKLTQETIQERLRTISDPALDKDLITLKQVKDISLVDDGHIKLSIELVTHAYPESMKLELEGLIKKALADLGNQNITIDYSYQVAALPPSGDKARLPEVKNIIAVAAGKGGVGKSTVATNLALALSKHGASVGLLDADIFGPSIPTMLGAAQTPAESASEQKIIPSIHHGIKAMSIGFFVEQKEAVVWRGPMIHRLLQQFMEDVEWGSLDYLICDLPPGTGDVQLSLSQLIPIAGSVMVTTPQEVSLIDVVKAINMFEKVNIPILGLIENMSYYRCAGCGHTDEIFSRGGGKKLAKERQLQWLGELPLDPKVRFGGDHGIPVVVGAPDSPYTELFMTMASDVALNVAREVLKHGKRSSGLTVLQ